MNSDYGIPQSVKIVSPGAPPERVPVICPGALLPALFKPFSQPHLDD
jgi:hypothetical protein